MKTIANRVALALTILTGAGVASAQDLNIKWDNALKIQSADKQFAFQIGGRIHHDWAFISNDVALGAPATDGAEFRRARVYLKSTIWGNVETKFAYDLEDGVADFKDAYVGLTGLPGGNAKLRVGQVKEPTSLEWLTSSNYLTFMERSLAHALTPERQTGISYRGAYGEKKAENLTYQVGLFRNTDAFGDANNTNSYNISGRVTGLPMQNKEKEQLLHVGGSFSVREYDPGGVTIGSYREIHLGNTLLSVSIPDAEDGFNYGLEAAYVQGPFSAQAEWLSASFDSVATMDPTLFGWYVQAAYTITGESRSFKNYDGAFGRITPAKNYGKDGNGAFEVAVRYSMVDYSDVMAASPAVNEATSIALGANWYLNPNTRVMGNWVIGERDGSGAGTGEESALQFRFQFNF